MPDSMARRCHGSRRGRRWALMGLTTALIFLVAACGGSDRGSPTGNAGPATQTSEGGEVTVKATWLGPEAGPVFTITLDTHSVDLNGVDLRQLATLRTNHGEALQPLSWDAPKSEHHREGKLSFSPTASDGTAVIGPETGPVELVIRDVAGVSERVFRWTR